MAKEMVTAEAIDYEIQLETKYENLNLQVVQLENDLSFYENEGEKLSNEILKTANSSFKNGEIDFFQYIQSIESAYGLKLNYLEKLQAYNETVNAMNYLTL